MSARGGDGGRLGGHGVVVQAPVERVGHLRGVTHQQRVPAVGGVGAVAGQGVGGHGDRVAGVQPVVAAVPLDGPAHGGRAAVPQARDAERSSGSRIRHTSERCCVQGRSAQSWANMPPRALTGAS